MSKYVIDEETLVGIANSIRAKAGITDKMMPEEMEEIIASIKTAAVLQSKAVEPSTSAQTVTADEGYDGLERVDVEAMPTAEQAMPAITVSATGLITASTEQAAGYVEAGTKSATKQLTVQAAKTVTPGTSNQTAVASGRYTTGAVTVKGDSALVAANIKSGVSIFGVAGTYGGATPIFEVPSTSSPVYYSSGAYVMTMTLDYDIENVYGLCLYMQLRNGYTISAMFPDENGQVACVETNGTSVSGIFSNPTISGKTISFYLPDKSVCSTFLADVTTLTNSYSGVYYTHA